MLAARASEYEADLPYALWTEALDRQLAELGDRGVARLGLADPQALAGVLPALAAPAPAPADRHRTHRALRDLLERLAAARPLVRVPRRRPLGRSRRRPRRSPRSCTARPPRRCCWRVAARAGQLPPALAVALAPRASARAASSRR